MNDTERVATMQPSGRARVHSAGLFGGSASVTLTPTRAVREPLGTTVSEPMVASPLLSGVHTFVSATELVPVGESPTSMLVRGPEAHDNSVLTTMRTSVGAKHVTVKVAQAVGTATATTILPKTLTTRLGDTSRV